MGSRLEQALALHCSPALFGIKSSNLINCYYKDFPNLEEDINKLNEMNSESYQSDKRHDSIDAEVTDIK